MTHDSGSSVACTAPTPPRPRPAAILVVDDDAGVRELLAVALRHDGHRVELAADGQQALSVLDTDAGIAVVITDLVMPERDGLEIIRALSPRPRRPRIVAMSGYYGGRFLPMAALMGADATLSKPFTIPALRAAVAGARPDYTGADPHDASGP